MVENAMVGPAPGALNLQVTVEGARGDGASSPATRRDAQRGRVVFIDFGRGKIYALTDDGEDVLTFESLEDLVGRLSPTIIVVDSLPNRFQNIAAELAKKGIVFLRLVNLKKVYDERKSNGMRKTDANDVKLLRTLYRRQPELFQPLFTSPEELEVRALTELWVTIAKMKMVSKYARTTTTNSVAIKINKNLQNNISELSKEIHEKALNLPLYRKTFEELGLKGPTLAYIVSHDTAALVMLPRDKLEVRYSMVDRPWRMRPLRSRLLISLANTAILNGHPQYRKIYEHHRQKGKKHWPAILRVAKRILRDLRQQTQKAGPTA